MEKNNLDLKLGENAQAEDQDNTCAKENSLAAEDTPAEEKLDISLDSEADSDADSDADDDADGDAYETYREMNDRQEACLTDLLFNILNRYLLADKLWA